MSERLPRWFIRLLVLAVLGSVVAAVRERAIRSHDAEFDALLARGETP